jgi:hypothetical protein
MVPSSHSAAEDVGHHSAEGTEGADLHSAEDTEGDADSDPTSTS